MWTVALTCSGNALGLTYEQFRAQDAVAAQLPQARCIFASST